MTAIIDYDAGNIRSVCNALGRLDAEYILTADPAKITGADRIILPGVGNAARAMDSLRSKGLCELIRNLRKPVLGICVGMQIMCIDSEEDSADCLGIFDAHVRRFNDTPGAKVPHTGWNSIGNLETKLFRGIGADSDVYFVHSYYAPLCTDTIATCTHPGALAASGKETEAMFSAALRYENFYGTQFHPEKSGSIGEKILRNFLSI